jgi:hypothetical protein
MTLTALLMLVSIHVDAQTAEKAQTRGSTKIGDVNGDGRVSVADVVSLVNLILKGEEETTDVEIGIRIDLSALNKQITSLEQRITVLEQNNMDVTQLKKDLESLKSDIAIAVNETNVNTKDLEKAIYDLDEAIKKASSTMVTGIVLQETLDCVVGTINLPGFNPAFLAAYVGENKTGVPEFPISGSDYNVDPNGYYLKASELPNDEDQFVGNSGKNSYLINGTGNAGTLYFTINPRKIDPSLFQFSLINSTGEESPIKLSDVQESEHMVTYGFGKNGNSNNAENNQAYLYEAKATCALEGIEKIHFDYTKFGYNNLWDAGAGLTTDNQGADANAQNMYGRFQYLVSQIKAKINKTPLETSLKIIQDFYNGIYSQRGKLQKQALRISWDDGENDIISGFDITTAIINPLNYKQMVLADNVNMPWSFKNFENSLGDLAKTICTNAANATSVTLKSVSIDGTQPKLTFTASGADVVVDITEEVYNAINNGMELSSLENMVNSIIQPYQTLRNPSSSDIMARVDNYLNKRGANAMMDKGGNIAWNAVEPILLFESSNGIGQFYPEMTINGDGAVNFVMTSLTEEYIVPAYRKYIALICGGKVQQSYSFSGDQKIVQLEIPDEPCEIIYQVSDFYGNVVTKRYPINRNQ